MKEKGKKKKSIVSYENKMKITILNDDSLTDNITIIIMLSLQADQNTNYNDNNYQKT